MKDFHLRFCLEAHGWYTGLVEDLLAEEETIDQIPDTGGAYVLGTSTDVMLTYPWGSSPIFYIGSAGNLQRRVSDHKGYIEGAQADHSEAGWWPRYQYGAAFGTSCAWYSKRGPQKPKNIEADLVDAFYWSFGAIPAANSSWPSHIKPKHGNDE